jgi:hypothetical protein
MNNAGISVINLCRRGFNRKSCGNAELHSGCNRSYGRHQKKDVLLCALCVSVVVFFNQFKLYKNSQIAAPEWRIYGNIGGLKRRISMR